MCTGGEPKAMATYSFTCASLLLYTLWGGSHMACRIILALIGDFKVSVIYTEPPDSLSPSIFSFATTRAASSPLVEREALSQDADETT
jgi:hypothetical protein